MHEAPETDLAAIIYGCRKKQRDSQRQLYHRFYAYGMSICLRYGDDEQEAILILNDGFLKVFNNLKKYDLSRPFKPWFRKILVNTAINHVRKYKKRQLRVDMDAAKHVLDREDILSRINYQELMAMVQSLTIGYRTVFNLYVIDGYKHEEIAEMLGISVGTSKSNLWKARERLKEMVLNNLKMKNV